MATPAVSNFAWHGDDLCESPASALGKREFASAAGLAARAAELEGQFALHQRGADGSHSLVRDPLGVNKLFFAIDAHGGLESSNFLIDLVKRGHPLSALWSVPSGQVLQIDPSRHELELRSFAALPFGGQDVDGVSISDYAEHARTALRATYQKLRAAAAGRPLYVTMSGGLDSTVAATLARELLGPFVGLSFELSDAATASQDVHFASRVAAELGIEFVRVAPSSEELLASLDDVLVYGQDWRDFNVHCGLVNWALARAIAARHAGDEGPRPLVITGDVMNELMADYSPVSFRGQEHYRLPRMSPGRMRRFLVSGLDTGDREVGIFSAHRVDVLQPYAICAAAYTRIPDALVGSEGSKQSFVREVMGDRIPSYIYERPKVRAQVGSSEEVGGTLALLLDHGFDSQRLASRFSDLFETEPAELGSLIRAGMYRFTSTYP